MTHGYITEWDGLEYDRLEDIRLHFYTFLTEKEREEMDGCPVLKKNKELEPVGFIRVKRGKKGITISRK